MPNFSKTSLDRLRTCHPDLQRLMYAVIEDYDFSVLCGHRTEKEQNKAYKEGKSKLRYPASHHNKLPSLAVDIAPYPIDWDNIERFKALAAIVKDKAEELDIEIEWGGDWRTFKDYPHWQLKV